MSRFRRRQGSPCIALIACGSGTLAVAATLLAGCGSGGGSSPTASATPTPSASASPTATPTPTPIPTATPTPVTTPTPTPTPSTGAYSLVFTAPPAGDDQANENPTPSQAVTITGSVVGPASAPTVISFQASHGSGTSNGDYSLQFYLAETGGIQVGHMYQLESLDTITYKETQSDGQIRQFFGNNFIGGNYTVVSIINGTVHLKGTSVMAASGTGGATGYFTLTFDITANLASN